MKDLTIRPYMDQARSFWALRDLLNAIHESTGIDLAESYLKDIERGWKFSFVYLEETPIGYCVSHYSKEDLPTSRIMFEGYENKEGFNCLNIYEIAVLPTYRQLGIGGLLVHNLITLARLNKCKIVKARTLTPGTETILKIAGFTEASSPVLLQAFKGEDNARFWELWLRTVPVAYSHIEGTSI